VFRTVSILVAALAQAASALTPMCLVRCVAPGGHACIEVAGRDCHCRGDADHEHGHPHDGGACHHEDAAQRSDAADNCVTLNSPAPDCDCEHSPLMSGSSLASKSRSRSSADCATTVALPAWLSVVGNVSDDGQVLSAMPFRPHAEAVALSLAATVLRV